MISVCLATYNGEKYIKEQLESILVQLSDNDEIIISDDYSTDSTIQLIQEFHDSRIKIYYNTEKKCKYKGIYKKCYAVAKNFENTLYHAQGDYIFLSDQDDVWIEGKVNAFLNELHFSDLVLSDCIITDADLNQIISSNFVLNPPNKSIISNIIHTHYLGSCMAFNKGLLKKILPLPEEPIIHDIWIALIGCYYGSVSFINKPYLLYRRHGNNVSSNIDGPKNPISFKILYRVFLIYAFVKRIIRIALSPYLRY